MTATEFETMQAAMYERKVRELHANLRELVESGDLTDVQANEWLVAKQDAWMGEGIN